jgi:hypothetical protein
MIVSNGEDVWMLMLLNFCLLVTTLPAHFGREPYLLIVKQLVNLMTLGLVASLECFESDEEEIGNPQNMPMTISRSLAEL